MATGLGRVASRVRGAKPRGRAEGRPPGESSQVEEERERDPVKAGPGRAALGGALPWAPAGRRRRPDPGSAPWGRRGGPSSPGERIDWPPRALGVGTQPGEDCGAALGPGLAGAAGNRLENPHSRGFSGWRGRVPTRPPPPPRGPCLSSPWPCAACVSSARPAECEETWGSGLTSAPPPSRGLTAQPPALLTRSQAGDPVGRRQERCLGGTSQGTWGLSVLGGADNPLKEKQAPPRFTRFQKEGCPRKALAPGFLCWVMT
ncbi:WW domain-binding protein 11-like [Moschus berezovskii]|uniref:WW domain-binding protein 11-like n=1 Tax=Moschus berezovskii TaxID=68408 RepID=UPI00244496C3|nr:WW domain-binding protein 11-like [Moschus berezovskii]